MDPRHLCIDERLKAEGCVFCGAEPDTADHAPPRTLLDQPYPADPLTVPACRSCNAGTSADEQYFACLLECVQRGTTDPSRLSRPSVARALKARPAIGKMIERSRSVDLFGTTWWTPDAHRVERVVLKLARAHVAYELSISKPEPADSVGIRPLELMSDEERATFEQPAGSDGVRFWPELGSRAFLRACGELDDLGYREDGWIRVQEGRYRYRVDEVCIPRCGDDFCDGHTVSIVIAEYLACRVVWK